MEFIIENYIWFVVAGVILLMALIGYIAEKTDFGRKEFEKKVRPVKETKPKNKKEEKVEVAVSEVIEEVKAEEIMDVEVVTEETIPVLEEDLTVPLNDDSWGEPVLEKVEEVTFDEFPKEEIVEELEQPGFLKTDVDQIEKAVDEIKEEIRTPEIKIEENNEVVGLENLELPAIESLKEEELEDDVWKF